ncbi:MAG: helix-turn-helix transcriptional regulator [Bacteroidaceae bacterium]|jgi:AraC-like DNA-binding protein|nr:helix-turn-helix transcriptional regulator [Bacteroidaceae bacterium]
MQRLLNMKVSTIFPPVNTLTDRGWHYETKSRICYGVMFCVSGRIVFYHDGKEIVSEPNTVVLLPKGAAYSLQSTVGGEFPTINFDCDTITPIPEFVTLDIDNQERYLKYFYRMQELSLFENTQLKMMETLYKVLNMLVMESNQKKYSLAPVITYIENNYSDCELTNSLLAKELNLSEVYVRRLFKSQFGTTPKQYILDIRLQKAIQLLTGTEQTVTEIASECGFASLYHFSRLFKDKLGETPLEYRLRHKDDIFIM